MKTNKVFAVLAVLALGSAFLITGCKKDGISITGLMVKGLIFQDQQGGNLLRTLSWMIFLQPQTRILIISRRLNTRFCLQGF